MEDSHVPSRNSCSDNCSWEAPSQTGVPEISVFTLSSLSSQRPIKPIISRVKLISAMDVFPDVTESVPPMQISRSLSKLLGWEGTSRSLSWIAWQRFCKSAELTSVGLTWKQGNRELHIWRCFCQGKMRKHKETVPFVTVTMNTSSSRWFPNLVFRCCGLPMHRNRPPTFRKTQMIQNNGYMSVGARKGLKNLKRNKNKLVPLSLFWYIRLELHSCCE